MFHSPDCVSTSTTLLKRRRRALKVVGVGVVAGVEGVEVGVVGFTAESGSHFFLAQASCVIWGSLICLSGLSFLT